MKKIWAIVCLIGGATSALADPVWVPPKGTIHTSFSFTFSSWDQFLETGSEPVDLPGEIDQYEFTLQAEYVPMENLSIDLTIPIVSSQRKFVYVSTDDYGDIIGVTTGPGNEIRDVDVNTGLGDVVLGAKYIHPFKGFSLGARPYIKFPGSYDVGYVVNAPGDGQTDLGLALLAGSYFPSIRMYIRGSFTGVLRFGYPANQIELMVEPGFRITSYLSARLYYQYIEQFGGEDVYYYGWADNHYPSVDEDSHRIGAGLSVRVTDRLTIFGLYQQTIAGQNTADMKGLTIGTDLAF